MNFITKEELEKKDIISKFSINNGNLVLSEDCEYKSTFDVGDIVTYKDNTDKIGVIYFIEDDEFSINWNNGTESTETSSNLVVVPPTIGLELLNNSDILNLWENLSNGKNESFDLKCIYLDNKVVNEVHFIKAFKNTNSIIDKKFKRTFTLYRKFGNSQIFRTNLYTISNGKIIFDTSRYVYYLLENNVIYYLGIDLNEKDKSFENILTNKTNEKLYGGIETDLGNETSKKQTSQVESFLNGVGSSIETSVKSLNDAQVEAENAQVAFARGDDISVHEVMIAAEKSNLSMQMAIQLRNKVINAYNEINQIKV